MALLELRLFERMESKQARFKHKEEGQIMDPEPDAFEVIQ